MRTLSPYYTDASITCLEHRRPSTDDEGQQVTRIMSARFRHFIITMIPCLPIQFPFWDDGMFSM